MKLKPSKIASLLGASLVFLSLPAAATTWNYYDMTLPIGQTDYTSYAYNAGGGAPVGTMTGAFAANTGTTLTTGATITQFGTNGMGMCSTTDVGCGVPNHALDNSGNLESLLISFGTTKVTLTNVTLGYAQEKTAGGYAGWADFTLLAYTGVGTASLTGKKYSDLTAANGWTVIGNYADIASGATVNKNNVSASAWLIAAYNSSFGGSCYASNGTTASANCTNGGAGDTTGSDYFKIYSVAGTAPTTGKAPEPSSIALAGIGLLGALSLRRRQNRNAA